MIKIYSLLLLPVKAGCIYIGMDSSIEVLSKSLNFCSNKYHTAILGYVLMPNHIHFICLSTILRVLI